MITKHKEQKKAMGSKSWETILQKELIQPGLMGSKCPDTSVQKEAHPTMDNGHESSSVSGDSGHYNEDAMLVDDALLNQDRKGETRGGTANNWSSAAVGNILGESAPTHAENVPIATGGASATIATDSATMPSFCATLLSPKIPKDTVPQAESAAGRPTEILIESLPPVTKTKPIPSGSNPFLRNEQCKNFWPKNLVQLARDVTNLPSSRPANMEFKFFLDQESAQRNFCILQKYTFDLAKALEAQENSPLSYGSEFKPTNVLSLIFALHPN